MDPSVDIFHLNINENGSIDLDILQKHCWLSTYSLTSALPTIKSLLGELWPSWSHPANTEATDLFLDNRSQYEKKVKAIVDQTFCDDQTNLVCKNNVMRIYKQLREAQKK